MEAFENCLSRLSPELTRGAEVYLDNVKDSKEVRSIKEVREKAKREFGVRSLDFLEKGETKQKMIAAASIVARDEYLSQMDFLKDELKRRIPDDKPILIEEISRLHRARRAEDSPLARYCIEEIGKGFAYEWIKTSFGRD